MGRIQKTKIIKCACGCGKSLNKYDSHNRVRTMLNGHQSRYHWANVSGKYLRDISDWIQLCVKCHKQFDIERRVFP